MKYLRMLDLAAVVTMALMAFIGVSSASATVLCKTSSCTETYGVGTEIVAASGHTQLTMAFGTATCTINELGGKTENTGSSSTTVRGRFTNVVLSSCNGLIRVLETGIFEIHKGTSGNGTKTSRSLVITTELFGVHCVFGTLTEGKTFGTVTGGSPATVDIKATLELKEGSSLFCGTTALWEGTSTVTSPNRLFIG